MQNELMVKQIEEAIVQLEIDVTNIVGALASQPADDVNFTELLNKKLEAIDIAIATLRAEKKRIKLFNKTIYNFDLIRNSSPLEQSNDRAMVFVNMPEYDVDWDISSLL